MSGKGWTPDKMHNSKASGLHGNSEPAGKQERRKAGPDLLEIGL